MADTANPVISFDIAKWDDEIKKAANARINFEQQWYINLAFYRGKQWVIWKESAVTTSGLALVNPKSKRKRLVFNRIKPYIRREFTKLVKEEPVYWVRPNTSDQSDIAAAKTGEAIAEYLAEACKFNKARRSAVWWAVNTGTGFTKTTYGPSVDLPVGKKGTNVSGAPVYTAPSPFHVYVPYLEIEDIQDQPWVCQQAAYDPQVVFSTYNKRVEAKAEISRDNSETRFRSAINIRGGNTTKQVLVKELWLKPCRDYPNGLLAVWSEQTILLLQEFPYQHGEFPYQKITHIPSGGFYGISTTEDLIPMQKEYNLTKSQIAEARDMTSKPALTVTKGSVDIQKVKAVPGQIIEVMPGADPPKRLINPDLPNYVQAILDALPRDMDDNAAQFEISKGRTPPGVEAASAIAYLQEENDTMLYHTVASLEEAVSSAGKQSLSLVQQYWTTTRIINTISKSNLQGVIEFKGSDLRNNIDLRVVSGSLAPRSMAAKQASVMELIKLGVVPPEVGLKYFQMSETDAMYEELHVDVNQAKRENLRMARGEFVEVNEWDNHIIHVQEIEQYMKSQEYELLPETTKQLFMEHRTKHQTIEAAENMQNAGGNAQPVSIPGEQQLGDSGAI